MLVGYARVSTAEQTLALQEDALGAAGCGKIFTDTLSGAKADRPGLAGAEERQRPGDALAVWRLDRLGRSLPALIATLAGLDERGIGFRSLTEQLDTTTSGGKLIFHVFGALAEFERDLIRERTRARGRRGGWPKKLGMPIKVAQAQALYDDRRHSVAAICRTLGISRATLYRSIAVTRAGGHVDPGGIVAPRASRVYHHSGIKMCDRGGGVDRCLAKEIVHSRGVGLSPDPMIRAARILPDAMAIAKIACGA